jgi:hypothetical protein
MTDHVADEAVAASLGRVDGDTFERFANEFLSAVLGSTFVPVGGRKDGGADGHLQSVLMDARRPKSFIQVSTDSNSKAKLFKTVRRLREVGRDPQMLLYVTSRSLTNSEQLAYDWGAELGVAIQIRDQAYIRAHINHSVHSRAAWRNHLARFVRELIDEKYTSLARESAHVAHPEVLVFLEHAVASRGDKRLDAAVLDALILWALEGTDPDKGIRLTKDQILAAAASIVPNTISILAAQMDERLEYLRTKREGERNINWHRADNSYVLPYDTRKSLDQDAVADLALLSECREALTSRVRALSPEGSTDSLVEGAVDLTMRVLAEVTEFEGLKFANYISGQDGDDPFHYVTDAIRSAVGRVQLEEAASDELSDLVLSTVSGVVYDADAREKRWLDSLVRSYSILFALQCDPKVVKYFEEMQGSFHLYVGTDLLIRGMSERFLKPESQGTRNLLEALRTAGSRLVLTEPVLEEVISHLRATDLEFQNYVERSQEHVTPVLAANASRILIRSYLYARLRGVGGARNWPAYINQYCEYRDLHRPQGRDQVRRYLMGMYGLTYESREQLMQGVSQYDLSQLTADLEPLKSNIELAENDALMVLAVYGRRKLKEEDLVTEFGYKTWWVTGGERGVIESSRPYVEREGGARFYMRPEFLLHYLMMSPSAAQGRRAFRDLLPSVAGVRLSRRVDERSFRALMERVKDWSDLEPARRQVKIAALTNSLMSQRRRQYRVDFMPDRTTSQGEFVIPVIPDE